MEFSVIGAARIRAERDASPRPGAETAVFARLVLAAPHAVSVDTLIEGLWGDAAPRQSRQNLATYVTRVRRTLEQSGLNRRLVEFRGGSTGHYSLRIPRETVDWNWFCTLRQTAVGLATQGDHAGAFAAGAEALDAWQGDPIPDGAGPWVERIRESMIRSHRATLSQWARAALECGKEADALDRLAPAVAQYPCDEQLVVELMRTLVALGRPADALAAYEQIRRQLAGELDSAPSAPLRALQRSILQGEQDAQPADALPSRRTVRDNLPRDIADFSAREAETAEVLRAARAAAGLSTTAVHVISGLTGTGKSTLAVHAAHQVKDSFRYRLHLDLRGRDEQQTPVSASEALAELLGLLGVHMPPEHRPASVDQWSALWRSHTRSIALLVVLDNAASADQVLPLIPSGPDCMAVITSHWRMSDLDGATHTDLAPLDTDRGVEMLRAVSGGRDDLEFREHAPAIAEACQGVPFTLRFAGGKLSGAHSWTPQDVRDYLRRQPNHEGLRLGRRSVRSGLGLALQTLPRPASHALLLLGLFPGPSMDRWAARALIGADRHHPEELLYELTDSSLISAPTAETLSRHSIVAAFVRGRLEKAVAPADRRSAQLRLLDAALGECAEAVQRLALHPEDTAAADPLLRSAPNSPALTWLRRQPMLELADYAIQHGFPGHAARMAHLLANYLDIFGPWDRALELHRMALRFAPDDELRTYGLAHLARSLLRNHAPGEALELADQAKAAWERLGDPSRAARALDLSGMAAEDHGSLVDAERRHRAALSAYRAIHNRRGEAVAQRHVADMLSKQGRLREAADTYSEALAISDEVYPETAAVVSINYAGVLCMLGYDRDAQTLIEAELERLQQENNNLPREALVLANLGRVVGHRGNHERALRIFTEALELQRSINDIRMQSSTWAAIAQEHLSLNRLAQTSAALEQCERLWSRSDPGTQVEMLILRAEAAMHAGRLPGAEQDLRRACAIARKTELDLPLARAAHRLGVVERDLHRADDARVSLGEAWRIYAELRLPLEAAVEAVLDSMVD